MVPYLRVVRGLQGATSHDAEELREGFWVQEGDKEEQLAPLDPLWLEMEAVGELREVLPSVLLIIATTTAAASWSHRPTGASCCYPSHSKRDAEAQETWGALRGLRGSQ